MRLVCLLPARNAEEDLPGYLESVARFADAVVALDDGSTDRTRALLQASPLVRVLLTNTPRETAAGWDDSVNRNRLLEAAAELDPDWILSLDADERIPPDDGAALRRFVESDALRGCAYGLRHHRMWASGYDPAPRYVYRLFAFEPGQRFPGRRLHFDPIPVSIPRRAWVRTSIRLQHLGAATEERRLARLAKYRETDPEAEFDTNFGGLDERPPGDLVPWGPRPSGLPLLVGPGELGADLLPPADRWIDGRPRLVCLLPARNAEEDLPGYLESVARFADAVVALDDGSTDRTRALLQASPLVRVLLTNTPRETAAGWDDSVNRNRLLEAAAELDPDWILSLDADERIPPDDGAALRRFVEHSAGPGFAYQFRVFRMIEDLEQYDRADLWVARLFAFDPGQRFPPERLHFVPVPSSIPRSRWLRTTLRIQHLGGSTEARRRARFRKYEDADPDRAFETDYRRLLDPAGSVHSWAPRPPDLPVLAAAHAPGSGGGDLDLEGPVLSAVVIARDDEATIARTVRSVVEQECPEAFEVIVVTSGSDRTAEVVRRSFPEVTVVELPRPALPGAARNAGLRLARGDYVSFPGSHVELPPGSLAARLRAHGLGYPMVTGSMRNATPTRSGWAAYFLDHSGSLPGRPSGVLTGPPAHCSYARDFLFEVGGFPEDMRAGEDTVVNLRLARRGLRAYRAQDVVLFHRSPCRTPGRLIVHHFLRGRALGRILLEGHWPEGNLLAPRAARSLLPGYVGLRVRRAAANVRRWNPELEGEYRRAAPLVRVGAAAAWLGAWAEVLSRPSAARRLLGRAGVTVAIVGLNRRGARPDANTDVLLLARADLARGTLRLVSVPRDLEVDTPGFGVHRLNAAYRLGAGPPRREDPRAGMRLLGRTIRESLGVRIDGWAMVDFDGFRRLVDGLGGIDVVVEHEVHDDHVDADWEGTHFDPGPQRLDGRRALEYARTRKADGDLWRRRRHVDILRAVMKRLRELRTPAETTRVVRALRGSIRTGPGLRGAAAMGLAALRIRADRVRTAHVTEPLVRSVRTEEGRWIRRGDLSAVGDFVRAALGIGPGGSEPQVARIRAVGDQSEATPSASLRTLERRR